MRKFLTLAMVAGVLGSVGFVGQASASPQIQLTWNTSSIVNPGGSATLSVILVNDTTLSAATLMVNMVDVSATAPKITAGTNTPAPFGSVGTFTITPPAPNGTQIGAFGGLTLTQVNPGTYTLGTVTVQAGAATGDFVITPFQRPGIDGWLDGSAINTVVPILHTETLHVIPEPGTVALLGLGLVGLVAVGRRSRA